MKRLITLAVGSALVLAPMQVSAQSILTPTNPSQFLLTVNSNTHSAEILLPVKEASEPKEKPEKPQKKPEPVVYTVKEGDNLSKIGTEHNVEWQRLWAKNKDLKHPDVIHVGDKITIPLKDEKLSRKIPEAVSLPAITPGVEPVKAAPAVAGPAASYDGSNTYTPGYCTWYVKNRRGASLPNGLGNANTWYYRAQSMGMAVGSTPRAGAVGTTTRGSLGHVVYVESVQGNGKITISEMNYAGLYSQRTRTADASEFLYIY